MDVRSNERRCLRTKDDGVDVLKVGEPCMALSYGTRSVQDKIKYAMKRHTSDLDPPTSYIIHSFPKMAVRPTPTS
jgi:hypothetical protein